MVLIVGLYIDDWLVNYVIVCYVIKKISDNIGNILVFGFVVFVVGGIG